jgi:hypothetical protein
MQLMVKIIARTRSTKTREHATSATAAFSAGATTTRMPVLEIS